MWKKMDNYEKSHHMLDKEDHIVVGLSGGADSVCLTEFLLHKKAEYHLHLYAVHVNHMLRGDEAKRDEEFVENYCKRKEIPCYVFQRDIAEYAKQSGVSIEEAGRSFRYECFEKVAEEIGLRDQSVCAVKLAVAHHMNDQAETLLFRITRGTGPSGLSGMFPVSVFHEKTLIRPLLCVTREEVLSLLNNLSEGYVTDSSNLADEHDRNVIRNHVIPTLTKMNVGVTKHISALSDQMRELMEYLEPRLDELFQSSVFSEDDGLLLSEETYLKLSTFEQKEICRRMLCHTAGKKKDITSEHVELLRGLMNKNPGKQLNFPYGMHAVRNQTGLFLHIYNSSRCIDKNHKGDYCNNGEPYNSDHCNDKQYNSDCCNNGKPYNSDRCNDKQYNSDCCNNGKPYNSDHCNDKPYNGDYCTDVHYKDRCGNEGIIERAPSGTLYSGQSAAGKVTAGNKDTPGIEIESSIIENGHILTVPCSFSNEYSRMTFQIYHSDEVQNMDFREENLKNHCIQYFDYDTIKRKLCVRTRQSGDYLVVDSQGNHKKLKRYMIDQKISSSKRDHIPLLAEDSHILWVPGGRISEYYKVQRDTKRVLKVEIE